MPSRAQSGHRFEKIAFRGVDRPNKDQDGQQRRTQHGQSPQHRAAKRVSGDLSPLRLFLNVVCHALYCSHFRWGDKWPCARATTATATIAAPACLSILAASLHVAPVVSTSSTNKTRAPSRHPAGGPETPPARSQSAARAPSPPGAACSDAAPGSPSAWARPTIPPDNVPASRGCSSPRPKPAAPKHRNGHNHVRPNAGQMFPAPFDQKSPHCHRQRVV